MNDWEHRIQPRTATVGFMVIGAGLLTIIWSIGRNWIMNMISSTLGTIWLSNGLLVPLAVGGGLLVAVGGLILYFGTSSNRRIGLYRTKLKTIGQGSTAVGAGLQAIVLSIWTLWQGMNTYAGISFFEELASDIEGHVLLGLGMMFLVVGTIILNQGGFQEEVDFV